MHNTIVDVTSDENFKIINGFEVMFSNEKVYDSFINALKELKEKIYSNVEKIIIQNYQLSDDLIENLKDSFNTTENILSNLDFFEDEYYDFSSIKDMVFYILDNKSLLNNLSFFTDLLNSFYNLIEFKKDASNEEYELKYEEFSSQLVDFEQLFYTGIYEPSKKYSEKTLSEISNSLIG